MHHATGERHSAPPKLPWLPTFGLAYSGGVIVVNLALLSKAYAEGTGPGMAGVNIITHLLFITMWAIGLQLHFINAMHRRRLEACCRMLGLSVKAQALLGIFQDRMADTEHPQRDARLADIEPRAWEAVNASQSAQAQYKSDWVGL
ncbi:hypothetical protein [Tardiphaga sp. 862_B3_N1_1]|uniref:hypothetical protein n=1 Tax=Tardiphaga sp. 862_B3_N1_1 TaxID=3240763 RepID=UPI003F8A836C